MDEAKNVTTVFSALAALWADDMIAMDAGEKSFIGRCVPIPDDTGSKFEPVCPIAENCIRELKRTPWVESALGWGGARLSPVVRISPAGREHFTKLLDEESIASARAIINADPARAATEYRFVEKRFEDRDGTLVPVYIFQPPAVVFAPDTGVVRTIDG
ncbi:MAG: hypothetical protein Q8P36_00045 [bacterium]|nr:hypothetical protein [bacterium]